MFLDSLAMMPPRWGWSSIDDGIYKHFAPLELADESAPGALFAEKNYITAGGANVAGSARSC